ncbi:flagella assembly protein FlgT [Shewanella dokdonensis]|uniref:Flagella assembly protein FlgT n=1 Tax=Shewanella dokdonensis TaxID=712036 RepID=A0ABX8DG47_9GAMM|nr:flagella assembly protein FlgT [Shewanella dokdonensis]MCL1073968.1 flagellar assembly protein FlgT [Shewanella dokdonensis]QVK23729.1 flagella assembly protein FlgT [Shewanella dokdonensis]
MKHVFCLLLLLGLSIPCQAYWVEATGDAKIVNGDSSKAREIAIQNALRMALLQNGGNFQASQVVSNGNLTTQALELSAAANVKTVELLNEQKDGERLIVTIKVDLQANDAQSCSNDGLKAAILIPQTLLYDRSQLRYGRLEKLPSVLSQHLAAMLKKNSAFSFPLTLAEKQVDIPTPTAAGLRIPTIVSEMTDSQYLLLPELLDISVAPATSAPLGLWQHDPLRQFQLRLTLYHGISGEILWQHDYATNAAWEFDKTAMVNPTSSEFWQSAYGENISAVLQQSVTDIDQVLNCRPLLAQIIARDNSRVILNIGRQNGVKKGDKFKIAMQYNVNDQLNRPHALATATPVTVTIDQTSETTATALINGEHAALNIQVNDIALKK